MRTILITGGTGFIGSYIARSFIEEGYDVVLYDVGVLKRPILTEALKAGRAQIVVGDILDIVKILDTVKKYNVEGIIHAAWVWGPYEATTTTKVNVGGVINLIDVARISNLRRVIFISSPAVYGKRSGSIKEDDPPNVSYDVYSATKLFIDALILSASVFYKIDLISVRPGGPVYGPYMPPAKNVPVYSFLKNALEGKPIKMQQGGDHTTELNYVEDFARGVCLIYKAEKLNHKIYNLSVGRKWSFFEVADIVRQLIPNAQIEIGPGFAKPGEGTMDPERGSIDYSRSREEVGYEPMYDLKCGMQKLMRWLKAELTNLESH